MQARKFITLTARSPPRCNFIARFPRMENMNTPMIIGRQTFDGLGRQLTVEVGQNITQLHYVSGQLAPAANTLADGKHIEFSYEAQLNNQLLDVRPQGEPHQRLAFHPLGMPASASGALGTESFEFSRAGQPSKDTWTVDDHEYITTWFYSLNHQLQGFDDAQGIQHRRSLDSAGRVEQNRAGTVTTRYGYDALSRLTDIEVHDPDNSRELNTHLTYDNQGREHTRTLHTVRQTDDGKRETRTVTQTLGYCALDQITSRHWRDGERRGEERFVYDLRQRLVRYTADADVAPCDPFGHPIVEQRFTYNALNGHEQVVTTYADGSTNETQFSYAETEPTRLIQVRHSHPAWPSEVTLTYDACGRVIGDSLGRRMSWNTQGRLTQVTHADKTCSYGYTASGRLTDRCVDETLSRSFFSGETLTHERTGDDSLAFCQGGHGLFAINKVTDGIRHTTLLGSDAQGSVRLEADSDTRVRQYSAYGVESENTEHTPIGFAGHRTEAVTGWQILGDYRPYDPVLMCFLSPDSESPFGRGGLNPYAYCAGDPVNRIDPDGHSWVNYALAGAGLAIGAIAFAASFGAASAVVTSLLYAGWSAMTPSAMMIIGAAALDITSLITGAAALTMELAGCDQRTVSILGWVSLGTGLAAGVLSGLAGQVAKMGGSRRFPHGKTLRRSRKGHVLFEEELGSHDVVFHDRLWGSDNLKGFETHGASNGYLLNAQGVFEPAANVAKREIAPRLAHYDQHRPLVLLACEGGSSGAAQQVANVLRRPVIGYDEVILIGSPRTMQFYYHQQSAWGIRTSLPLQKVNWLKRFTFAKRPAYMNGANLELATSRIYQPL